MRQILIYAASGAQASPLLTKLHKDSYYLYALSRNRHQAHIQENEYTTVIEGSVDDTDSLHQATADKDIVMLNLPFFSETAAGRNAIGAAQAANVSLIIWNANGEVPQKTSTRKKMNTRLENMEYLVASGIPYVVFQPTVYLENLLMVGTARAIRERNVIESIAPAEATVPWISADDISECMVRAIDRTDLYGKVLTVAGSGWTGTYLTHKFSQVLGRDIAYQPIAREEYIARLDEVMGAGHGAQIMGLETDRDNRPERAAKFAPFTALNAFEELNVTPLPLEDWVAKNRKAFTPGI